MKALVFGGSGQTGRQLLKALIESPTCDAIVTVGRRSCIKDDKVNEIILQDITQFGDHVQDPFEVAFCAIGASSAGISEAEFEYVERDLIVAIANKVKHLGCKKFILVSGFMSHPDSRFFIPRVKGQCEELLKRIDFEQLIILRPGLLRCAREETSRPDQEVRWLERLARVLSDWIDFGNWWSISTQDLANVLVNLGSRNVKRSLVILEHYQIVALINDGTGLESASDQNQNTQVFPSKSNII